MNNLFYTLRNVFTVEFFNNLLPENQFSLSGEMNFLTGLNLWTYSLKNEHDLEMIYIAISCGNDPNNSFITMFIHLFDEDEGFKNLASDFCNEIKNELLNNHKIRFFFLTQDIPILIEDIEN